MLKKLKYGEKIEIVQYINTMKKSGKMVKKVEKY